MEEDLNNSNISSGSSNFSGVDDTDIKTPLEKDFYGCYCLKFRVKHGTTITELKIKEDFGHFGEIVNVWGAGVVISDEEKTLDTPQYDSVVRVWFKKRYDAVAALGGLKDIYHELTPAISDVLLPDNFGLFTISFLNKVSISTDQVYKEFSQFGPIKLVTGQLNIRGGRVFVSYVEKECASQAFINKTERWFQYMRFEFPKCERDYTGCYTIKFYNNKGSNKYLTEEQVRKEFGKFGTVVDVRGPGLFDTHGNDVYVRYKEKASIQVALSSLVGCYDTVCITPATDIKPDKYGWYTLTFINVSSLKEDEVGHMFQKFGHIPSITGTWGVSTGRIFVSFTEKNGAITALQTMLTNKQFHLQLARGCKPFKMKPIQNRESCPVNPAFSNFGIKRKRSEMQSHRKRPCAEAVPCLEGENWENGAWSPPSKEDNIRDPRRRIREIQNKEDGKRSLYDHHAEPRDAQMSGDMRYSYREFGRDLDQNIASGY